MFGLKEHHIREINVVFSKYNNIDKVVIYGSRAKGTFTPGSDIDLTLIGNKLDLSTISKIETELDDLLLPYKIDLSIFHTIENSALLDHIRREGRKFYEKQVEA